MARVLVLTDRTPRDTDWKGAFAWQWIVGLAESQHEVRVLTTQDPELIAITHPRLTIGRPAASLNVRHLARFLQGIVLFRPEIIQTFAFAGSGGSRAPAFVSTAKSSLSVWPYLHGACRALPGVRRFSAFFEAEDLSEGDPALLWHRGSESAMVFTPAQSATLKARFELKSQVVPMEVDRAIRSAANGDTVLVPAPVSEWRDIDAQVTKLAEYLKGNPGLRAAIVGGWGSLPALERRAHWTKLMPIADRVTLLKDVDFGEFQQLAASSAQALWLFPLKTESWRHVIASATARRLGLKMLGPASGLEEGSTANFLSRLYAHP